MRSKTSGNQTASSPEDLRLGRRELFVCQRAGGVELRQVLDLVRWICWRWHILTLAVVNRRLIVLLLLVAMVSYRTTRHRPSNKSSTPCPSPHSHGNSLRSLG
jgi:hypothetical protein